MAAVDGVEIEWVYRPDDRSKQGKRETLPKDVAALKVREGLAKYPPAKPEPALPDGADDAGEKPAKSPRAK